MSILLTIWHMLTDEKYRPHVYYTLFLLMGGASFYHYYEGWTWVDAVYFSVITLTTIGYGDISPQTDGGKIFTVIYIMSGLGILLSFIHSFGEKFKENSKEELEKFKARIKNEGNE